jgi:hypothetical protein
VDKGKWEADLSGIQTNKFNFKKQYSVESYEGRENFEYDFATTVENSRIRIINEVLPGKAAKESSLPVNAKDYFDVPKTPKQTTFDNSGSIEGKNANKNIIFHTPEYQFSNFHANKIFNKNGLRRLTEDESGTLLPVHELKEIGGRPKAELDVWKKDILLEELEPKTTVTTRSFSVPNTYSKYWGIDAAGLGIISSSYFTKLGEPVIETTKNGIWDINVPKLEVNTAEKSRIDIISGNRLDIRQGIIPGIRQDIIPEIRIDVIPEIRPDVIPDIIPDQIPDIIPDQIPDIIPDQIPDQIPEIKTTYIFTESKINFPFGAGDFNFNPGKESYSPRRKTKNKKLKNKYGDPFKVGIKIKL